MKANPFLYFLVALLLALLTWSNLKAPAPVYAKGPFTVVRLQCSPTEMAAELNKQGKRIITMVPDRNSDGCNFIAVLQ